MIKNLNVFNSKVSHLANSSTVSINETQAKKIHKISFYQNSNIKKKQMLKPSKIGLFSQEKNPTHRIANTPYSQNVFKNIPLVGFGKPKVQDPKLKEFVNALYRPHAKIGNGSTADAIRYEAETGEHVGGRTHTQKGEDALRGLDRWIKKHPKAQIDDISAAKNIISDLREALSHIPSQVFVDDVSRKQLTGRK